MATVQNIYDQVRFITNQDSTTLPATDILRILNEKYKKLVMIISSTNEDYFGFTATASITANQQTYSLPTDLLKLKRVEITYDGSNWYWTEPIDSGGINTTINLSANINNLYSESTPRCDIFGDNIIFYPVPDEAQTGGIKYWYIQRQQELTATGESPSVLQEYHDQIIDGVLIDVYKRLGFADFERKATEDFERGISKMKNELGNRMLDHELRFQSRDESWT